MKAQRFFEHLESIYNTILIVLISSMFITVTYNVFMRFVINQSVGWADELSRFLFIWTSFIGAVIAFKNDEHVGLSFVVDKIKSIPVKRGIAIIRQLLVNMLLGFLAWFGYQASTTVMNVSPALSIPMASIYLIVPVCGLLMLIIGIGKLWSLISGSEMQNNTRTSIE